MELREQIYLGRTRCLLLVCVCFAFTACAQHPKPGILNIDFENKELVAIVLITDARIIEEPYEWYPPSWQEVLSVRYLEILHQRPGIELIEDIPIPTEPYRSLTQPAPRFTKDSKVLIVKNEKSNNYEVNTLEAESTLLDPNRE